MSAVKRNPVTALPWKASEGVTKSVGQTIWRNDGDGSGNTGWARICRNVRTPADAAYIAHAANAYPKLIEALGELAYPHTSADMRASHQTTARNLLRELGEQP